MSGEDGLSGAGSSELPVEELLRRVKPMPPPEEFVIDDLNPDEGEAFLATVKGGRATP